MSEIEDQMADPERISLVAKSGEICIQTSIGRSTHGLLINIWAQPRVEDFIRSLGTGEHLDVHTIGRHWLPSLKRDDNGKLPVGVSPKLMVYDYSNPLPKGEGIYFRLDNPGYPLIEDPSHDDEGRVFKAIPGNKMGMNYLNLSFLRLVGISEQGGVSFSVKGVYERSSVDKLGARIESASKQFYREYLKPYRLIVTVSTMPIPENF